MKPIQEYLPKADNVFTQLPVSGVKGYLPAPSAIDPNKLPVLASRQTVQLKPIQEYLPKSDIKLENIPGVVKGYLPAPNQTLNKINENIKLTNPELARQGSVVYTTHTPETLANANSIGANAKGADKLAELLKNMNA